MAVTHVTDPKVDALVREKLITSRIALLIKAPFFGNLATRLELVNADDWLTTAATDGRKFYYNSQFVNSLPQKQLEFLMGHEVLHAVYDHMGRRGDRDAKLFNIAADYCVNADLIQQRIGEKITVVPILYDRKYDGMSAEQVYDLLYKQADKIDIGSLVKQMLDEHMDGADEDGAGAGEDGEDKGEGLTTDGKGRPRALTNEEKKEIRDEVREAVMNAAKTSDKDNIPGNVQRMINEFVNPQLNWREIIRQQIQCQVKSDYTFAKMNRKSQHLDAILPGSNFANTIDVAISIDSSGSIGKEMLRDFLSEVRGIMETFDDFRVSIWCIDTKVYNFMQFTPDNVYDLGDYVPAGGGGNSFEVNWDFMREQDLVPKLFIMFTDGYPCPHWSNPGDEDYCETLFLLHSTTTIQAPFGETAYYDLLRS